MRGHSAVASGETLEELADVLAREKFSLTEKQIARFLEIYIRGSEIVQLRGHVDVVKADPDDNIVLDTAVDGKADFVVTGDKHLLALERFEGIQIITVDAALRLLAPR
jgi:uncharacterized protein